MGPGQLRRRLEHPSPGPMQGMGVGETEGLAWGHRAPGWVDRGGGGSRSSDSFRQSPHMLRTLGGDPGPDGCTLLGPPQHCLRTGMPSPGQQDLAPRTWSPCHLPPSLPFLAYGMSGSSCTRGDSDSVGEGMGPGAGLWLGHRDPNGCRVAADTVHTRHLKTLPRHGLYWH